MSDEDNSSHQQKRGFGWIVVLCAVSFSLFFVEGLKISQTDQVRTRYLKKMSELDAVLKNCRDAQNQAIAAQAQATAVLKASTNHADIPELVFSSPEEARKFLNELLDKMEKETPKNHGLRKVQDANLRGL